VSGVTDRAIAVIGGGIGGLTAALALARHGAVAQIWMAPGRHVVTYPMRNNVLNIVAVQEQAAWAAEGWHHADDPANLRAAFDDVAPPLRDILTNVAAVNQWGLFRHPVAARWYNGRLAILGDAAHPTLPFLAQGANMAIEDAYVLARALMDNPRQGDALQAYQAARAPRVTRAIAAANANAIRCICHAAAVCRAPTLGRARSCRAGDPMA